MKPGLYNPPRRVHNPPSYITAHHLRDILPTDCLHDNTARLAAICRRLEFDAIAYSGESGALLAIPLSMKVEKPLVLVRKRGVKTHSTLIVEGDYNCNSYIIVDDLVCTGTTIRRMVDEVKRTMPRAKYLGGLFLSHVDRYELDDDLGLYPLETEEDCWDGWYRDLQVTGE